MGGGERKGAQDSANEVIKSCCVCVCVCVCVCLGWGYPSHMTDGILHVGFSDPMSQ